MKKLFRSLTAAVLAAVLVLALVPAALAAVQLPSLPADKCVVDDAGVLSDETEQYLDQLNGQLEAACSGAQIGVLTVQNTGDATTEEYALEAFNTWGIGSAKENNGILIILVMDSPNFVDGDYYLMYGDGFEGSSLAEQASALAQIMEDSFIQKDYDAAVVSCADAVAGTIAGMYNRSEMPTSRASKL